MKAAAHPAQERRLAALRAYDVLDTPPEPAFDEIARLAAAITGKRYAVVNLIDAERQFFKAEVGFGIRELPLNDSICAHVILGEDFTLIRDTQSDPRLRENPLCLAPGGLRFYAGALLKDGEGLPIGTLCVLDDAPGDLDAAQREALAVLARQVMAQLDLRRALREADLMRREADHRIKNALQSVAAMVRMEARRIARGEGAEILRAIAGRVEGIAALNAELYGSDRPERVDLGAYLPKVGALISRNLPAAIRLELDADPAETTARVAGAMTTILTELAANSIKHAWPEGDGGWIRIEGSRDGPDGYRLSYADDGTGLDAAASAPGLGTAILAGAVRQTAATPLPASADEAQAEGGGFRSAWRFPL